MLPDFKEPAATLLKIIILILLVAVIYNVFNFVFRGLNRDAKKQEQIFVKSLMFDFRVERVIDGDTLEIKSKDGKNVFDTKSDKIIVRLLGINTPEYNKKTKQAQCFGKEAKDFLKDKVEGKTVAIEIDDSQNLFDEYGRLLGYLYVKEEGFSNQNILMINDTLIKDGFAYEYTFKNNPYKYQKEFLSFEKAAEENGIGL